MTFQRSSALTFAFALMLMMLGNAPDKAVIANEINLLQSTRTVTVSANNETEALVKIQRQNPGWVVESIRRIGNTNSYQARLRKSNV